MLINQSDIKLIDFENIEQNTFNVVTELTFKNGEDEFRPDITFLINGLPLIILEVKKPNLYVISTCIIYFGSLYIIAVISINEFIKLFYISFQVFLSIRLILEIPLNLKFSILFKLLENNSLYLDNV